MNTRSGYPWSAADIPDQTGRVAVVTGANAGLGYETARALAAAGAHVVLACRNLDKAAAAEARIRAGHPSARLEVCALDLADLAGVRAFAARLADRHPVVDLLVNNAGIMAVPHGVTADGFERQFGTNHLGHHALTGLVLPAVLAAPAGRVVTVSSLGHRAGRIAFDELMGERRYWRWPAYFQSKLANLLFTAELQRRLAAAGAPAIAVAAHPGGSVTELGHESRIQYAVFSLFQPLMQSAAMGALPTLRVATDPAVRGGEYYGPGGLGETTGPPVLVSPSRAARDTAVAARLWEVSSALTGVDPGDALAAHTGELRSTT
jgi:NAD(P)-dependent dehydrogenase (short-subunit alcohol dehydrogenase family)